MFHIGTFGSLTNISGPSGHQSGLVTMIQVNSLSVLVVVRSTFHILHSCPRPAACKVQHSHSNCYLKKKRLTYFSSQVQNQLQGGKRCDKARLPGSSLGNCHIKTTDWSKFSVTKMTLGNSVRYQVSVTGNFL